jgi:hypothetical protein
MLITVFKYVHPNFEREHAELTSRSWSWSYILPTLTTALILDEEEEGPSGRTTN